MKLAGAGGAGCVLAGARAMKQPSTRPKRAMAAMADAACCTPALRRTPNHCMPANARIVPAAAVLDPYVNAVHVSLLREKQLNPVYAEHLKKIGAGTDAVRELGEKLLAGGPEKIKASERMAVLADQGVMVWLHQQVWLRPEEKLAPWWKAMIREFSHRE